jgi:hypothetical protein
VLRVHKNMRFPDVSAQRDALVSVRPLRRTKLDLGVASEIDECDPVAWVEVSRGQKASTLFEQVLLQQQDYRLILLHIEALAEEDDDNAPEDRLTPRERLEDRMYRRRA